MPFDTDGDRSRSILYPWIALALIAAFGTALCSEPARAQESEAENAPTTDRYGAYRHELSPLADPGDAVLDASGNVYVCETGAHRIRIFDAEGNDKGTIGSLGDGPGKLDGPRGIAIGADGNLYVADTGNHRVQIFTPQGSFVGDFGGYGSEPGRFHEPTAIAIAGKSIAVVDSRNDRVQILNSRGQVVRVIGEGRGHDIGELERPLDVAIGPDGRIFVVDSGNSRVQVFEENGAFVRTFGDPGPHVGFLAEPEGIEIHDGRVYVADTRNHRIQVFTPEGQVLYWFGLHVIRPHEGSGKLHYPSRIAIAPDGDAVVVVEGFEDRCQVFGRGNDEADSKLLPAGADKSTHFGHAAASEGDLFVVTELDSASILVHDLDLGEPVRVTDFGGLGSRVTQFSRPGGVAIDFDRQRLFLSDSGNRRIAIYRLMREPEDPLRYDPFMGRFVKSLDLMAAPPEIDGAPRVAEPGALALAPDGTLFVADPHASRVHVYTPRLAHVRSFSGYGKARGMLRRPGGIALSPDGSRVYVADTGNRRVQIFSPGGDLLGTFGKPGTGPGEFLEPLGILAADDGYVYVVDRTTHRVQKFDANGEFKLEWGSQGIGAGEFFKPSAITRDASMKLYVVDLGNHRTQIFTTSGTFLDAFGARLYVRAAKGSKR